MKTILTILWMLVPVMVIYSQALSGSLSIKAPRGYEAGYLILTDSTKLEGWIRNNIRHWSSISILQQNGSKTTYTASQLREAVINRQHFLAIEDEWFNLVEAGEKINLLQKASAVQDGIQYNGAEPVGTGESKGIYGDYFLQWASDPDSLILVTKKNLDAIVREAMARCEASKASINMKRIALKDLREVVKQFNDCP